MGEGFQNVTSWRVFIPGARPNIYPEECITHPSHEEEAFACFALGAVHILRQPLKGAKI